MLSPFSCVDSLAPILQPTLSQSHKPSICFFRDVKKSKCTEKSLESTIEHLGFWLINSSTVIQRCRALVLSAALPKRMGLSIRVRNEDPEMGWGNPPTCRSRFLTFLILNWSFLLLHHKSEHRNGAQLIHRVGNPTFDGQLLSVGAVSSRSLRFRRSKNPLPLDPSGPCLHNRKTRCVRFLVDD